MPPDKCPKEVVGTHRGRNLVSGFPSASHDTFVGQHEGCLGEAARLVTDDRSAPEAPTSLERAQP